MGGVGAVECGRMCIEDVVRLLYAARVECGSTIDPDTGETIIISCKNAARLNLVFCEADEKTPTCLFFTGATGGNRTDRKELFWTVYLALKQQEAGLAPRSGDE
jgi:hypothetical protein